MAAPPRAATLSTPGHAPGEAGPSDGALTEDDIRALIALAALGGPDRLAHSERVALGRALDASPALRAELRALAAVAAALPATPRPATAMDRLVAAIPPALLRVEVIAALAAAILLLGVVRLADGAPSAGASVAAMGVAAVEGSVELLERPWGTEVTLVLDGTEPGRTYDVILTPAEGEPIPVGSFVGHEGTARLRGTAAVPRTSATAVEVTDETGDLVLRAELP